MCVEEERELIHTNNASPIYLRVSGFLSNGDKILNDLIYYDYVQVALCQWYLKNPWGHGSYTLLLPSKPQN